MIIKIPTRVAAVEKRQRLIRAYKRGDDVVHDIEDLGWFVRLQGSYESLFVGMDEPNLKVGDSVVITIAKVVSG